MFSRGLKNLDHPSQTLWVVRGIRGFIVALALISLAGGIYFDKTWPLLFGLVFLGEELLETGIMVLVLRRNEKGKNLTQLNMLAGSLSPGRDAG